MADAFAGFGYSLGMTMAILLLMKVVLRVASGRWTLLGDNEEDKFEAELEYKEAKNEEKSTGRCHLRKKVTFGDKPCFWLATIGGRD